MQQPLIVQAQQQAIACECCGAGLTPNGRDRVVVCPSCGEGTAVQAAPYGKKFVRCPFCRKLLLASETCRAVNCVRNTCGKTIILAPPAPGKQRGWCPSCNKFLQYSSNAKIAVIRCNYCQERALVRPEVLRRLAYYRIIVGFLLLFAGVVLTAVSITQAEETGGVYVAWTGLIAGGLIWMIVGCVYVCRLSLPEVIHEHEGTYTPPPSQPQQYQQQPVQFPIPVVPQQQSETQPLVQGKML